MFVETEGTSDDVVGEWSTESVTVVEREPLPPMDDVEAWRKLYEAEFSRGGAATKQRIRVGLRNAETKYGAPDPERQQGLINLAKATKERQKVEGRAVGGGFPGEPVPSINSAEDPGTPGKRSYVYPNMKDGCVTSDAGPGASPGSPPIKTRKRLQVPRKGADEVSTLYMRDASALVRDEQFMCGHPATPENTRMLRSNRITCELCASFYEQK